MTAYRKKPNITVEATSPVFIYDSNKHKSFKTNNWCALKPEWVEVEPTEVPWVGTPYWAWWEVKKMFRVSTSPLFRGHTWGCSPLFTTMFLPKDRS